MIWRDRLQPASFRGVAFDLLSDGLEGIGRRNQLHQYPKRDHGYVEDIGRNTESITIEAQLVGPDYLSRLDDLLRALRAPGPGELVHPFYGRLQVVANATCSVKHSSAEGGMCKVSLSFTEAGENRYPTSLVIPTLRIEVVANQLNGASSSNFARRFRVAGHPQWVADTASADIERFMGVALSAQRRPPSAAYANQLGEPAALAGSLQRDLPTGQGQVALQVARAFGRVARPMSPTASDSASRRQVLTNRAALLDLMTRFSIAQAAQEIVAVEQPVFDDLLQWRDQLTSVIDRETERPGLPLDEFEALAEVRAAVSRYVSGESLTAARLRTYTPRSITPAVVLAYDLYGDASRSDELVGRNGVRHPGFVPIKPLKVLTA